ncbi:MAG: thiamine pyrophosphate-dependent enzyme [Chlamydiia bacterium]
MSADVYHFYEPDREAVLARIGKQRACQALRQMLLIRHFEQRGEAAYQQGQVGGFYHSYVGQEAIQTAAVMALGPDNWWSTSYRCHALALLLGVTPNEAMAELYGRAAGNAKGRGGSMHFYTNRLLGGFGIVGGQVPIGVGAAFTIKYLKKPEVSVIFLGDGAVAQGAFHEALNIAALWNLPALTVIENNQWGMGTAVGRAISVQPIAELKAPGYGMPGYSLEGSDFLACFDLFEKLGASMKEKPHPVLVEAVTERFRGHSISDPALYRDKETLQVCMAEKDPIIKWRTLLTEKGWISDEQFQQWDREARDGVVEAMKYAEGCPWPELGELEQGVYAPEAVS